jgi:hypothetical protein
MYVPITHLLQLSAAIPVSSNKFSSANISPLALTNRLEPVDKNWFSEYSTCQNMPMGVNRRQKIYLIFAEKEAVW